MNSKYFNKFYLVLLVIVLILVSCSSPSKVATENGEQDGTEKDGPLKMVIGTATTGGSGYMWATAFSDTINKNCATIELTPIATGGIADNIEKLRKGEIEMGMTSSDWINDAYNGVNMPEFKGLRNLWTMYDESFHMITFGNNPAETIYDFLGKKVSFGNQGGGSYASCEAILDGIGLSFDDFNAKYLPTSEGINALEDAQIDAQIIVTSIPQPSVMGLTATMREGIKLIPLDEEDVAKVKAKYPAMVINSIPAGSYEGVNYDVLGIGGQRNISTTVDLPDDVAYIIAKTIHENHKQFTGAYAGAASSTAELTASSDIIPLHPGVKKYLGEIGLLK